MDRNPKNDRTEIMHYGILGMRWGSRRTSSKIDIKKYLMDNDKIYRDLILGQQQHEAKWGPPSAADLQFARESLQRQGVKFP